MYQLAFDITLGEYRLRAVEEVVVRRSVETLADTAEIVLPATRHNRALGIERQLAVGDRAGIRFGYRADGEELAEEFRGRIASIATDDGSIRIRCEDDLFLFRRPVRDAVLSGVTAGEVAREVLDQVPGNYKLVVECPFLYDRFTIYEATAFDVLQKLRHDLGANIYLRRDILFVVPQHRESDRVVYYDFARNIERSELKYRMAEERRLLVVVEGSDAAGKSVRVSRGAEHGERVALQLPGVSDPATLARRAEEELARRCYTGYEGSFRGWLLPRVEPGDAALLRDEEYPRKNGSYFVAAVESRFSASGGSRTVTLSRRMPERKPTLYTV